MAMKALTSLLFIPNPLHSFYMAAYQLPFKEKGHPIEDGAHFRVMEIYTETWQCFNNSYIKVA